MLGLEAGGDLQSLVRQALFILFVELAKIHAVPALEESERSAKRSGWSCLIG